MADKIIFPKKINDSVQVGDELWYSDISNPASPTSPTLLSIITSIGYNYVEIASGVPTGLVNILGQGGNQIDNGDFTIDANNWTLGTGISWVNEAVDFGTPLFSLDPANGICYEIEQYQPTTSSSNEVPTEDQFSLNGTLIAGNNNECGYTGDCTDGQYGISYLNCLLGCDSGVGPTSAELTTWINSPDTFFPTGWCGECLDDQSTFIQNTTHSICTALGNCVDAGEGIISTNVTIAACEEFGDCNLSGGGTSYNVTMSECGNGTWTAYSWSSSNNTWTQHEWDPYYWVDSANPVAAGKKLTQDVSSVNVQTDVDYIVSFVISNYVSGSLSGRLSNNTSSGVFPNTSGLTNIDANGSYTYTVTIDSSSSQDPNEFYIESNLFEGTVDDIEIWNASVTNTDAFFMFRKLEYNGYTNISSLKGYFAEVEFSNDSQEKQELFAIGSEVTISSK